MRAALIYLILAGAIASMTPSSALAFAEGGASVEFVAEGGDLGDCQACHVSDLPFPDRQGPHGAYSTTTEKCAACHGVHDARGGLALLPRDTVKDNCMVCHDGTGGYGVYGTLEERSVPVSAEHRVDATTTIPGGDAATGGSATRTFGGEGGCLSCNDCHSPHGANTVAPFSGERVRFFQPHLGGVTEWKTSHLLKKRPTGAGTDVSVYGSDWCAACHAGRSSGLAGVHNHPVDSLLTTSTPFKYDRVAAVKTNASLETTFATLGLQIADPLSASTWSNRGFVMPYPRTAQQSGHSPICQQCHEDVRTVGEPGAVVSTQFTPSIDGDGLTPTDNPRFQTFPHEGANANFLVETEDDLCLNCHPASALP